MARYLKRRVVSKQYSPFSSGCPWCSEGKDTPKGLCDHCVRNFKRKLCSPAWKRARVSFLHDHPLCSYENCQAPATDVHHTHDWRFEPSLFWDTELWQGYCHSHHSLHTYIDTGFKARSSARQIVPPQKPVKIEHSTSQLSLIEQQLQGLLDASQQRQSKQK